MPQNKDKAKAAKAKRQVCCPADRDPLARTCTATHAYAARVSLSLVT
jgi:hypothetical protein